MQVVGIYDRRGMLSVTNLSSENSFTDIPTECSSYHHFDDPDDNWSIQSKCRQLFLSSSW